MQLPEALSQAVENEIHKLDAESLTKAIAELSERYRAPASISRPFITSEAHRVAYISARLPATYAAVRSVLQEARERLPEMRVRSLLDLGAGPGTAMWAAAEVFDELEELTLIEKDRELIELGKRLAQTADHPALSTARWLNLNLQEASEFASHDLVVISYALGELPEAVRRAVVHTAWQAATSALVIIEPGTPRGFSHVLEARSQLISLDANIIAPCPHAAQCPLAENDWCHFAQRVERSILHRRAKNGTLSYEDEKFSYLAVAKFPGEAATARIIRHPLKRMGHIHLDLCASEGLRRETVSKKNKEAFRRARKTEWGSSWEDSI